MEHVVFFPAHDGTPAFRRVSSLEDAVRLVEHLRNVEGVSEVSCHSLSEVPLAFKTWYRVEMPSADGAPEAPATLTVVADAEPALAVMADLTSGSEAVSTDQVPAQLEVPSVEEPIGALSGSNGHAPQKAGPSSLGFFSQ